MNTQLRIFNGIVKRLTSLRVTPTDRFLEDATKLLSDVVQISEGVVDTALPTSPESELQILLVHMLDRKERQELFEAGRSIQVFARDVEILLGKKRPTMERAFEEEYTDRVIRTWKGMVNALEIYSKLLQGYLPSLTPAPQTFQWKGIRFENFEAWRESDVKKLLSELEWLFNQFKRRGVEKILTSTLKSVKLLRGNRDFVDDSGIPRSSAGHYTIQEKSIAIRHSAIQGKSGRFLHLWLAEIFLHELGHHVHLNLLPTSAKEFWDSGWRLVDKEKEKAQAALILPFLS